MILVSPAERPQVLRDLGTVSSYPETVGSDFYWVANKQTWGVQRKELGDFIASVTDGRLAKEVAQMKGIDHGVLIIEGAAVWSDEGKLLGKGFGQQWTRAQHQGIIYSLQAEGIWHLGSSRVHDTAEVIKTLFNWSLKSDHVSLQRRPGPVSIWGSPSNADFIEYAVQSVPTVGPKLAKEIVKMYGWPFTWKIGVEDLMKIDGIGRVKAEKIFNSLA